jgi:hypothetical protein
MFDLPDAAITRAQIEQARLSVRGYRHMEDLYRIGHPRAAASVLQMGAKAMLVLSGRYLGFLPCHMAERFVLSGDMRAIQPRTYAFESQHFRGASARQRQGSGGRGLPQKFFRSGCKLVATGRLLSPMPSQDAERRSAAVLTNSAWGGRA